MGGPARFFVDHPVAYALSLAGSGGTALYALAIAARPGERRRRVLYAGLGIQCAVEFFGMAIATERVRWRRRRRA